MCKSEGYIPAENVQPAYIIASDKLSYDTLAFDDVFSVMIYNGAKVVFVNSARFERPSARTAEVFAKLTE